MIRPDQAPYPEILRRARMDSHQYDRGEQVLQRITDRIWVFHVYHVAEIDHEGYVPQIDRDHSWHDIRAWLETRSGVDWLRPGHTNWPDYMNQFLVFLMLRFDVKRET